MADVAAAGNTVTDIDIIAAVSVPIVGEEVVSMVEVFVLCD